MPPGFLAVLSEPGEKVTIEEFQDWYNNEHVPLRLDHLPSFLTGARYSASDSCLPSWIALYDIDDTSTFNHESYTRLRANRSLREGELVKRLELLDRRTCELLTDENKGLTSSYDPKDPTKFLLTQGVECRGDEEVKNWLRETAVQLNEVEGWTRTRGYRCIDNLKSGISVGSNPKEQEIPRYLVVHGKYRCFLVNLYIHEFTELCRISTSSCSRL